MELNHLKYFYAVAQKGGFTKAAESLHIQQPAVSKIVNLLEDELGVKLIERHKRKVYLTKVGQEIFEKCEKIFNEIEDIKIMADGERHFCKGPLVFCAAEPIASHIVPSVNSSYLNEFPKVIPSTSCGVASHLFDRIKSGEYEFGVFFHVPNLSADLEIKKMPMIPYELVVASKYSKDKKILSSFIGSREIDDTRTQIFPTIQKMKKTLPETKIRISSNSLTAHKNMVLNGLGVSILPRYLVETELREKKLKRVLPNERFNFPLKLVTRKNKFQSRNAKMWLKHLDLWIEQQQ